MTKARVAIYARVSTSDQQTLNQRQALQDTIARRDDWQLVSIYEDEGVSGGKSPRERPAMGQLVRDATRRKFDVVAVWSIDRLGRSLQDLVGLLSELESLGIGLYMHQQAMDTSTPTGKAMFQMVGVFAEFERQMIRERVQAGLERARSQGKQLGGARNVKLSAEERIEICERRFEDGDSVQTLATEYDVSRQTIYRVLDQGLPEKRTADPFADWLG